MNVKDTIVTENNINVAALVYLVSYPEELETILS